MVAVSSFGIFEGKRVDQFTLTSDTGVEVDLLNWGCVVRDWRVPVNGAARSVVLGFDEFDHYPKHSPYFGAVVGRVANRIGGARFRSTARPIPSRPMRGRTHCMVGRKASPNSSGMRNRTMRPIRWSFP